jgi:hypothetical protein
VCERHFPLKLFAINVLFYIFTVTQLKINNQTLISLQLLNMNFQGCLSRSKSVVVSVKTSDQLHVTMPSTACYFDESSRRFQTFTGMRLF